MSAEISLVYEEIDERTRKTVWSGLGHKSVTEIAEETGLTPEKVFRVKRQLFEEIDVLTIEEQITKALVTMQELAESALARSKNVADERNYAGIINASVGAQEKILKQLRAMKREDNSRVTELNELRIRELLTLMTEVVEVSVKEISEEHDLDEDELYEVFNVNLVQAARNRELS